MKAIGWNEQLRAWIKTMQIFKAIRESILVAKKMGEFNDIHPRSLTVRPWKMMLRRWVSFLGKAYFQGRAVKLQECMIQSWRLKCVLASHLGGGFNFFCNVHPYLGKMNPFWRSYFSKGLKPPTSHGFISRHLLRFAFQVHSLELTAKAPENWWLGNYKVSGRVVEIGHGHVSNKKSSVHVYVLEFMFMSWIYHPACNSGN